MHVTVQRAWLIGVAVSVSYKFPWRAWLAYAAVGFVALAAVVETVSNLAFGNSHLRWPPLRTQTDQDFDRWMPPELAAFSSDRFHIGSLTDSYRQRPTGVTEMQFVAPADVTRSTSVSKRAMRDALGIAIGDLASRAQRGGYPGKIELATGKRLGRGSSSQAQGADTILLRPPGGTQEVGQCFRDAYRLTGFEPYRSLALGVGRALACSQRHAGGWSEYAQVREPCVGAPVQRDKPEPPLILDERSTQLATAFLIDLYRDFRPSPPDWIEPTIRKALDGIIRAQYKNGAWPQVYPPRHDSYQHFYTFNDGVIASSIWVLLKAHRQFGEPAYVKSAARGADFAIQVQGPPGQAGWAQQYDLRLRPAPARSFEPAGFSSDETGEMMNALIDLYTVTGERRFLAPLESARHWLSNSQIRPGVWARLYEPGTNRPIYGDRDGKVHYSLAELSDERRRSYRWEGAFPRVVSALARHDALVGGGLKALREYDDRPSMPLTEDESRQIPAIVREAVEKGHWSTDGILAVRTFVENCDLLVRAIDHTP